MKKFGKKNLVNNYDIGQSTEYEDEEDNFNEREYSKRLNKEMLPKKENEEKYFLFKKIQKNSNSILANNKTSTYVDNLNRVENSKPKLIRLSELENSNLYFILNIDEASNKEAVKRAYKQLCLSKHPDKGGNSLEFQKINKAYQILSNDLCRKLYDNFSHMAMTLIDQILNNSEESLQFILDPVVDIDSLDLEAISEIIKINSKN